MISDSTLQCGEEILTVEDESIGGINYFKAQISKLSTENEQYRQDLHQLHRKLEISRNMEKELAEYHKVLEQTLERHKVESSRKIHEMEEKYVIKMWIIIFAKIFGSSINFHDKKIEFLNKNSVSQDFLYFLFFKSF